MKNKLIAIVTTLLIISSSAPAQDEFKLPHTIPHDKKPTATQFNENYQDIAAEINRLKEELSSIKNTNSFTGTVDTNIKAGMIIPYWGKEEDAAHLSRYGWYICNGTVIIDEKAADHLRKKKTPDLTDRFLYGSLNAGDFGGSRKRKTEAAGNHSHGKHQISGSGFGDDNNDNQFLPGSNGNHQHDYDTMPPFASVIYLMYVRVE